MTNGSFGIRVGANKRIECNLASRNIIIVKILTGLPYELTPLCVMVSYKRTCELGVGGGSLAPAR